MTQTQRDPYLDKGMEGYIKNTAIKEFWRVAHWYDDPADLIQDGYLCYCKCRVRYVDQLGVLPAENPTKEQRRWMMSLVMTTFERYLKYTIAGKMRGAYEIPVSQLVRDGADGPTDPWEGLSPRFSGEAELSLLLHSLPKELQELVVLLAGDGAEVLGFCRDRLQRRWLPSGRVRITRRGRRPLRETTNQYYCRLLGLDPTKNDLVGQLRTLLSTHLIP